MVSALVDVPGFVGYRASWPIAASDDGPLPDAGVSAAQKLPEVAQLLAGAHVDGPLSGAIRVELQLKIRRIDGDAIRVLGHVDPLHAVDAGIVQSSGPEPPF